MATSKGRKNGSRQLNMASGLPPSHPKCTPDFPEQKDDGRSLLINETNVFNLNDHNT
jgi:hypothetical protein